MCTRNSPLLWIFQILYIYLSFFLAYDLHSSYFQLPKQRGPSWLGTGWFLPVGRRPNRPLVVLVAQLEGIHSHGERHLPSPMLRLLEVNADE